MLKVLGCIAFEHDPWLVSLSAVICVLGCLTTTTLIVRADPSRTHSRRWLAAAALVFGGSVWSLHFVSMLAFVPAQHVVYDLGLTLCSAGAASAGALAGFLVWQAPARRGLRVVLGGVLLGLGVAGMHYLGVAAMKDSALVSFDRSLAASSVLVSVASFVVALVRAGDLGSLWRRIEVAAWLALAICALHFIGMAAVTVTPAAGDAGRAGVLGTTALAVWVGGVSTTILFVGLAAIIVEQHVMQNGLQELGRMRFLSNLAREALLIHRDGTILEVNSAGERLFRTTATALVGHSMVSLFAAKSVPAFARRERCLPLQRRMEQMEVQVSDGTSVCVELTCQPVQYQGKPATVVALRDITDRMRDEALVQHLAGHDALTGLPNRYTLLDRLGIALETAAQQNGALAVVFIDIDRLKPVNDLYGHAAGDSVLVEASRRMVAEIPPGDTLARIGGDEFVMVLATEFRPDAAAAMVTRLAEALQQPFQVEGHRIRIGVSVGIALYPENGSTADTLIRAADAAMYRAKEEGRGALRFYEASMNTQLQTRLQLRQELAGAIDRNELFLHYQPIVNGITGELETFEALVRWSHPRLGLVPPSEFIPLAEQSELIDRIGCWVIGAACREAAGWASPWGIAVNVSPKQFEYSDVCDVIGTALRTHGLQAHRLVVEVTEGILIGDATKAVAKLNQLHQMGVRISLDDFGTGYSSLSYLQLFKFDKFKIDKAFVKQLGESEDALTLTRTIINLGHNLGLRVTAEGVENQAQLAILRDLRCDQIQGYLVAHPAPVGAFGQGDRQRIRALFGDQQLEPVIAGLVR